GGKRGGGGGVGGVGGGGGEAVAQLSPVALVALERGAGPAHDGLAAQQVGQQRLVLGVLGVRRLERGQRVGVRARAAPGAREDRPRRGRVGRGRPADGP